jgi:hypothetical protein
VFLGIPQALQEPAGIVLDQAKADSIHIIIKHDNHVTLLATIYLRANTTHVFIFTTCFGCDAPSSDEAEYNTSNYKSLLNCNITYNKT